MGIPVKGSRTTEVDGRVFRYLVKETHVLEHADQKELSVTIQEDVEDPGNVLQFRAGYGSPVSPGYIALAVRHAFALGWVPSKRGAPFTLPHDAGVW